MVKDFYKQFPNSYIQCFDDTGRQRLEMIRVFPMSEFQKNREIIEALNEQGAGVFFTPNPCDGGRKEENVTQIDWVYIDMDKGTKEEMKAKILSSPIHPDIVTESFRSYHCYWKVSCSKEQFHTIVKGLIQHFDADPAISSINEVLRLPGFFHMKDETNPFMIELRYFKIRGYSPDDMISAFPYAETSKTSVIAQKEASEAPEITLIKQIPIKQVLESLGIEVRRNTIVENGELTSATINEEKNYINRFSGKEGSGSTIDAVMYYGKMELKDAIKYLKELGNITEVDTLLVDKPKEVDPIDLIDENPFTWGTEQLDEKLSPIGRDYFIVVAGETGHGKCLGKGTRIIMYDGTLKNVEDIKVGDKIMGDDSTPRTILSLSRGKEQMYWIRQRFGIDYRVNESHILSLKNNAPDRDLIYNGKRFKTTDILDISVKDLLSQNKTFQSNANGFKVPFGFKFKKLDIDPYFLGIWLGDGDQNSVRITISEKKVPIVEYLFDYANDLGLNVTIQTEKSKCSTYSIVNTVGNPQKFSLQNQLHKLEVLGNKHIPLIYKANSISIQKSLLAGILDTDGYMDGCGFEIIQKREVLARDIKFLADALGFKTRLKKVTKTIKSIGFSGEYWLLNIYGDFSDIPFLYHKPQKWTSKKGWRNNSIKIEKDTVDDYYGFIIDGNHRFLLEDGTVTHNTAWSFDMAFKNAQMGHKVLYLSLEMNTDAIYTRIAREYAKISKAQWRNKKLIRPEQVIRYKKKKTELLEEKKLVAVGFSDGVVPNIDNIRAIIKRVQPDIVFIDNFDLIVKGKDYSETSGETAAAMALLASAKGIPMPIVLLHHLRKGSGDGKKRNIDSLRGSGKIGHNADIIIMVYRPPFEEGISREEMAKFTVVQLKDRDYGIGGFHTCYFEDGTFKDKLSPDMVSLAIEAGFGN